MIKRDTIQRVILTPQEDEMGGRTYSKEYKETVQAHCSNTSTLSQITQYGVKDQMVLNTATNIKLDEYVNARYEYSGKLFKIVRQVKQGNEYFQVLMEVNE